MRITVKHVIASPFVKLGSEAIQKPHMLPWIASHPDGRSQ
jgi:hypothetical protein